MLSTGDETLRVLVVEDDRDTAETARRLEPHIVLCDIGLPDADGYVVGSVLRQASYGAGARMIAVSGFGEPQHRRRALAAGFDQHLVKPVDPKVLLHELQVIH